MSTQLITNINNEIYIGIVDTIVLRLIYNANTVYDKIVHVICLLQWQPPATARKYPVIITQVIVIADLCKINPIKIRVKLYNAKLKI